MFDDERDYGQYFVWRYEEEQLILMWRCADPISMHPTMAMVNEVDELH